MKILQLVQKPQLRGAEIFASQLSEHLRENGHEVIMICLTEGIATLPFKGKIIYLNRPLSRRLADVAGWKQLAGLIREHNPDILQANAGDTLKFAVFSKLLFLWKTPIIFRNANKVSDFIDSKMKLYFNAFLVKRVTHVISVSELCRLDFIKTYAIKQSLVTTVPIGIEMKQADIHIPADLKSFLSDGKILVHAGSFVPEKNQIGLVAMVKQLIDQGMNIKLVLIGDGKLKSAVQKRVSEWKLENHILLTGYRTDVLSIMANANAFVLPSLIEGLPGVILEAMHVRTPVVAFDVGGVSEVVKTGETGWLVKAGDEKGFVATIQEVLHGKNTEMITENAFQLVRKDFDNRIIAQRFLKVYDQVTTKP